VGVNLGALVLFTLGDVVCPEMVPFFEHVGPRLMVQGQVVCLSDSGDKKDHFAIVDVDGIHVPLIVPTARIRLSDWRTDPDSRPGLEIEATRTS
jgi:hypothetical protein